MSHYILKDKQIIKTDLMGWAKWAEENNSNRIIKYSPVTGIVSVSTVFLGLDHNHTGYGEPVLFETMIFGGEHDGYQERYTTYEEAEAGHDKAVEMIFEV